MLFVPKLFSRLRRRWHAKKVARDATTKALIRHGVYSVEPYWDDPELRKIRVHVPYSFWAATRSILVLSLLLWWIPTFGQMVAGYIGGRRAGSHWKAILAALVPVIVIWTLDTLGNNLTPSVSLRFLYSLPGRGMEGLAAAFPEASAYILMALGYLRGFARALQNTLNMGVNGYMVTIIFAYIGGMMAEQNLKELEFERQGSTPGASTVVHHHWGPPAMPAQEARWTQGARLFRLRQPPEGEESYPREPEGWVRPQTPSVAALAAAQTEATREEEEKRRERDRRSRLDREVLVQRLVERALRDYDRSG